MSFQETVTEDGQVVRRFVPPATKKVITVHHRKMVPGMLLYCRITSPIADAKALKNARPTDAGKKVQQLLQVFNLETERPEQITVGFVLKDILDTDYPNNAYVGKYFSIGLDEQKSSKSDTSRRYNTYSVSELEAPPEAVQVPQVAKGAAVPKK